MNLLHRLAFVLLAGWGTVTYGMGVSVLDSRYRTDLFIEWETALGSGQFESQDRSIYSATPLNETLTVGPALVAQGVADALSVSTSTRARGTVLDGAFATRASADARSELTFQTAASGMAPLSIAFAAIGDGFTAFMDGFATLYDRTLGRTLFDYSLDEVLQSVTSGQSRVLNFGVDLSSSHIYTLRLGASSDANFDGQDPSIALSGFEIVPPAPEPETYAMALIGLLAIGLALRRRGARRPLSEEG